MWDFRYTDQNKSKFHVHCLFVQNIGHTSPQKNWSYYFYSSVYYLLGVRRFFYKSFQRTLFTSYKYIHSNRRDHCNANFDVMPHTKGGSYLSSLRLERGLECQAPPLFTRLGSPNIYVNGQRGVNEGNGW